MNLLENGEEKIQKICDAIRSETLEPAKEMANEIIQNAKEQADKILKKANEEKERIIKSATKEIERQKKIFDSSLQLSSRQVIDLLKQKIEKELFSKNLKDLITKNVIDPKIIANLINSLLETIDKAGLETDISIYVPKIVDLKAVNKYLISEIIDKLKEKELLLGDFQGGIKIKLHDMQITLDISDEALKNLISEYLREDFRKIIFNKNI